MSAKWWPNSLRRWTLILAGYLTAVTMAMGSLGTVSAAPILTLTPERGPCASRVLIQGTGLPPGQTLGLSAFKNGSDLGIEFATPTVGADGSFALEVDMSRAIPGCLGRTPPLVGTPYVIYLNSHPEGGRPPYVLLASTTFTVAAASAPATPPGLPNTGGGGTQAGALLADGFLVTGGILAILSGIVLGVVRLRRWVK